MSADLVFRHDTAGPYPDEIGLRASLSIMIGLQDPNLADLIAAGMYYLRQPDRDHWAEIEARRKILTAAYDIHGEYLPALALAIDVMDVVSPPRRAALPGDS